MTCLRVDIVISAAFITASTQFQQKSSICIKPQAWLHLVTPIPASSGNVHPSQRGQAPYLQQRNRLRSWTAKHFNSTLRISTHELSSGTVSSQLNKRISKRLRVEARQKYASHICLDKG